MQHLDDDTPYRQLTATEGYTPHLCEYYINILSNSGCPIHREHIITVTAGELYVLSYYQLSLDVVY